MKVTVDVEVRYGDLDTYGHVNNVVFFRYFETARTKAFRKDFLELLNEGIYILVVKAECEYKRPIQLVDKVFVTMEVVDIGNTSFTIAYKIHDDNNDTIYATGKTVMVTFDNKTNKPVKIPDKFLKLLKG